MRPHILLFLALFLSLASASQSPFHSAQHYLVPPIEQSTQTTGELPWALQAYCINGYIWKCFLSIIYRPGDVLCRCVRDPSNSQRDEKEDEATLDIKAEIQPGNNETLVHLFQVQCEEDSYVGCVSRSADGFICGCHEHKCHECEDDSAGYENAAEVRSVGGRDGDGSKFEESRVAKSAGFQFHKVIFPRCGAKAGYRIHCKQVGSRVVCYCGP